MMFHALTKDIEESFFAENMSAFIALAPVLTETPFKYKYEEFIEKDWNLRQKYPYLMGKYFHAASFCEDASYNMCAFMKLM